MICGWSSPSTTGIRLADLPTSPARSSRSTSSSFWSARWGLAGLGESGTEALCSAQAYFDRWAAIPQELTTGQQLPLVVGDAVVDPSGAPACQLVAPDFDKLPLLSAVTAMFLHGGWAHLLGNMLFLAVFGNNVEDRLGRIRFLLFYLACGIAATYAFAFTDVDSRSTLVGRVRCDRRSARRLSGLVPECAGDQPRAHPAVLPAALPAWLVLGTWFVVQAVYSLGTGMTAGEVAYVAHLAGFAVGLLFALALGRSAGPPEPRAPYGIGTMR